MVSKSSPQPRYKIYSAVSDYLGLFKSTLFKKNQTDENCNELETAIERKFNSVNAICMPQARVAVYLAVKALISKNKNKVILSPYTVADVINMVIVAGGEPVFCDVERRTCNIDPNVVERLIDNKTGAVMVTHLHGLTCDMEKISDLCRNRKVPLIEDAAQAFGAIRAGKYAGTFGDIGIYSFGRYKNLVSFFGGMMVTPHDEINHRIRNEIGNWPRMPISALNKRAFNCLIKTAATSQPLFGSIVFELFRFGHLNQISMINKLVKTELDLTSKDSFPEEYACRMTSVQAGMVLSHLDRVDEKTKVRINYASLYQEGLSGIDQLILPPKYVDGEHIYTCYPIQYEGRTELVRHLMTDRRDVAVQHLKNTADLAAFSSYYRDCQNARKCSNAVVMLPTYPEYTGKEVEKNITSIRSFFNTKKDHT